MNNLAAFSIVVNFISMIVAIWLAIYVVTRSPRSSVAWLTGLTLFSLSGWFLNFLLAINPPSSPTVLPAWLSIFLWLWPAGSFQHGWGGWLQGWQVTPAIMFWHHATMLMRPGRMNSWRWSRVIAGYVVAMAAIVIQLNTNWMFTSGVGDPLYLNTLKQGPLYPLFMGFLFLFTVMSLINLIRSGRVSSTFLPRKHFDILTMATLIAGLTGPTSLIAFIFGLALPRVILSILLGSTVLMMGYGVARYSALMAGRVIGRDFIYNGFAILFIALLYWAVGNVSVLDYRVPAAALIFIVILAIFTHALIDVGRLALDFIFYRRQTRELRTKLRRLVTLASEPQALEENISVRLHTLCNSVRATYGFILVFDAEKISELVSYKWNHGPLGLSAAALTFDDAIQPKPNEYAVPLEEAALIIPLYTGTKQIGVMILGRPENAIHYSDPEIEHLLEVSDHIADLIHTWQRETEYLQHVTELTQKKQPAVETDLEILPIKVLEEVLRNLHDFAYLGTCPLAALEQVKTRLTANKITHLDRGRAVHEILLLAIEKLCPIGDPPREPIPREWYPYMILHEAYVNGVQNRDIMNKLYISEGTFNRTRRNAIRSLAWALMEMEQGQ